MTTRTLTLVAVGAGVVLLVAEIAVARHVRADVDAELDPSAATGTTGTWQVAA